MWRVLICTLAVLHAVRAEDAVLGKLVAVDNPNVKRDIKNKGRNQVFANREAAFLKKDGDLFKIHRPGLFGAEKEKTVSFESVKFPGFYLRQKNKRLHLDNLQSRYIKKDATFFESKDPIGETFRLYMHTDQFLCHEPDRGFNLVMLKDSPKRDTLNCAFNFVPSKKTLPQPKPRTNGTTSPGPLKNNAKSQGVVGPNRPANNTSQKVDTQKKGAVKAGDGSEAAKAKSQEKASQPNVPIKHLNELVNDLKGNKDPFAKHKTNGLIIISGKAKQDIAKNQKLTKSNVNVNQAKQVTGKSKEASKSGQAGKPALKNGGRNLAQVNKGLAAQLKSNVNAFGNNQRMALRQPGANQVKNFQAFNQANKNSMLGSILQPVRETEQAFLNSARNHWILGNPTKKVFIANPRLNPNFAPRQPLFRPNFARYMNPYARNFMRQNTFGYPRQVRPSPRQFVSLPNPQLMQSSMQKMQIQYVPPQQWNQVSSLSQSQLNAGISPIQSQINAGIAPIQSQINAGIAPFHSQINAGITQLQSQINTGIASLQSPINTDTAPVQEQHVYTQETHAEVSNHPVTHEDPNSYSPDNLLSKLHPELSLDHNANHDINDITSTDAHVHHETTIADIPHGPVTHTVDVTVGSIAPHAVSAPPLPVHEIGAVPASGLETHVVPSMTEVAISPDHVIHEAEGPDYKHVIDSSMNLEAAHSLVHTHPDVTLEEAFNKMNPIGLHPIEITSEPIHVSGHDLHTAKAFNMRTHYVESKPLDMDSNEADSMKEVHVVHHNHHLVHAADESEKEKFVSTLVDATNDLCISLVFVNQLGNRYRLVSTLNPHGYRPKGNRFSLKTIFKVPKKRKVMSFRAYDELDPQRLVLLNGRREFNIYPIACSLKPIEVIVDSSSPSKNIVMGSRRAKVNDKVLGLPGLKPDPHPAGLVCPPSCRNECGGGCPMSCCSDASSSLLH